MPAILGIGTCFPRQRTIEELSDELGLTSIDIRRFRRGAGFDRVCFDPDRSETDLLVSAIEAVPGIDALRHRVTWVVRARTLRFASPWPNRVMTTVCERAGLGTARTLTISDQACASGMFATDLAVQLLADDGDEDAVAVVLMGEKTYGSASRVLPRIALMGEATVAVAVTIGDGDIELLGYASRQVPIGGMSLALDEDSAPLFTQMFDAEIKAVIGQAFSRADVDPADLDRYLPHNVGRIVGVRIGMSFGLARDQIDHGTLADTGHCWSADNFMSAAAAQQNGRLKRGDVFLMSAVGYGATFAAMVCRYSANAAPASSLAVQV